MKKNFKDLIFRFVWLWVFLLFNSPQFVMAGYSTERERIPPDGISLVDGTLNPNNSPVYMGNIVDINSVATLSGQMELSVDFPAYNSPVDIWIIVALPDGRFYMVDESGSVLSVDKGIFPIARGVSGTNIKKQILEPFTTGSTGTAFDPWPDAGLWWVCWLIAPDANGDLVTAIAKQNYELGFYIFNVGNSDNDNFNYGTSAIYNLSSATETSVNDSITGNSFNFPDGANGTLTITPILSVPEEPVVSGTAFMVEYSDSDSMQMFVPHNDDETALMWIWTEPEGSIYDSMPSSKTWLPLPNRDTTANPAVFDLVSDSSGSMGAGVISSGTRSSRTKPEPLKIVTAKLKKDSYFFTRSQELLDLASQDIQNIVLMLPDSIRENAVKEINGRLHAFMFPNAVQFAGISKYHPFSYLTGNADPYFVFCVTDYLYGKRADQHTVAHEVGHYISHVLTGDDKMRALDKQALKSHDKGDAHNGRPMVEEYAYFADYVINYAPQLTSASSIEDFFPYKTGDTPSSADWPSKEGYATSLLAKMHTENADQTDIFSNNDLDTETIPLINASITDLWGILAKGPLTVDELYQEIYSYLSSKNSVDKLWPLLERSGWSYNGYGKVVDELGNGLSSATVQSIAKVPSEGEGKEYQAPIQAVVTDENGKFIINRIFPGSNFIRIKKTESSEEYMDFPFTVDPKKPTNIKIDLGTFTLSSGTRVDSGVTEDFHGLTISYSFDNVEDTGTIEDSQGRRIITGKIAEGRSQVCVSGQYRIVAPINAISRWDLMPGDNSRFNEYNSNTITGEENAVDLSVPFSYCKSVQSDGVTGDVSFVISADLYFPGDLYTHSFDIFAKFSTE